MRHPEIFDALSNVAAITTTPQSPLCVFRTNVTGDFGIVTEDSGPS